jgi:hypothetical protein
MVYALMRDGASLKFNVLKKWADPLFTSTDRMSLVSTSLRIRWTMLHSLARWFVGNFDVIIGLERLSLEKGNFFHLSRHNTTWIM